VWRSGLILKDFFRGDARCGAPSHSGAALAGRRSNVKINEKCVKLSYNSTDIAGGSEAQRKQQWIAKKTMALDVSADPRKVLIVDDNADAAILLSMLISAYGHETVVANSGPEGLALAESFVPEVVFLDLGMPGMSGYDVAISLRRIPCLSHVYIAALTGWSDPSTRARVISTGFNSHLTKPADLSIVLGIIDGYMKAALSQHKLPLETEPK
jgi:CheY-like chemotaxis protein